MNFFFTILHFLYRIENFHPNQSKASEQILIFSDILAVAT